MKRYIRSLEQTPPHEGNVGIWWFYNNKVVGDYCPVSEGVDDRGYIQFSKTDNHIPEALDLLSQGYRSIERGRVVYNVRSQVYEIICSQVIASDEIAINLIAEAFDIADLRYDVIPSSHYYVPTLTGNPTLDNFDYGD